jgi:DNA replicative helicase MCM subunit Mcm2 (Cdc46/Mcm family)
LRDEIALQNDERIAKHILATRAKGTTESMRDKGLIVDKPREDGITNIGVDGNEHLTTSFLRKYVAYAKLNVYPQLNEEARLLLLEFYRDERQAFYREDQKEDHNDETSKVPITARALEALSRLAEAHARMHLRDIGTEKDAKVAIAVFKHWRSEGNVEDESEFHSSRAAKRISPDKVVRQIITRLCEEKGEASIEEIYEASEKKEIKPFEVDRIISKLRQGGLLFSPREGAYSFA